MGGWGRKSNLVAVLSPCYIILFCRDYLSVKVWDLHMESKPIETFTVSTFILNSVKCKVHMYKQNHILIPYIFYFIFSIINDTKIP